MATIGGICGSGSRFRFWPFGAGRLAKNSKNTTTVHATTNPIEATVNFQWNIQKFNVLYPNPDTYEMSRNVLFKKLVSPTFTVATDNLNMPPSKWQVQMICDEEPSAAGSHYLEIGLRLEEFGKENRKNAPPCFIWELPKDEIAVRCKLDLVNEKEEVLHSETLSKTMSHVRSKCGFLGFTTLETLWKEKAKYFSDNILRIRVELTVISETTSTSDDQQFPPQKLGKLGPDFGHLLSHDEQGLADVTIRCQSKTFSAHKQILSARCAYFERMLKSDMVEGRTPHVVDIVDTEPETFFSMLHYLYTDSVDFELTDVRKLCSLSGLADKYGLEELKDYCFSCLQLHINLTNAGTLAVFAYFYNASKPVAKNIKQFCHANWSLLSTNHEFQKMVAEYPAAFTRNF